MIKNGNAPSSVLDSEEAKTLDTHKNTDFLKKLNDEINTLNANFKENKSVFPTKGLPKVIADFAFEIANVYGVPVEFPALSAICAVSAALRKKFVVDNGKYINYGQLWVMFVAPPGVGKTEPVSAAFRPLQKLDNESYNRYRNDLAEWKKESAEAKQNRLIEPDKPIFKQCLIDDFTPESLYQTMFRNNGAISLYRDELSGWFSDFGRYSKNGEISRYLSIFNNAQFGINRKSEDPIQIPVPFMTICGTIQPEILEMALSNNNLKENGFASRFLYVYPQNIKKQKYSELTPDLEVLNKYEQLIHHCYSMPEAKNPFILTVDAKEIFIEFANQTTDLVNTCPNNFLRATYAKMEIQALRLSLVIQIIKGIENTVEFTSGVISREAMQYAIDLCNYFNACVQMLNVSNQSSSKTTPSEAIKIINNEYGIKNKQSFADAIGVSRQYISKLCNDAN